MDNINLHNLVNNSDNLKIHRKLMDDSRKIAENIGMDGYLFSSLYYEKSNIIKLEDRKKFKRIEDELKSRITDKDFLTRTLSILEVLRDYSNYKFLTKGVYGTFDNKLKYRISLYLTKDAIRYSSSDGNIKRQGILYIKDEGNIIEYRDKDVKVLHYLDNNREDRISYYFIRNKNVNSIYNKDDVEVFTDEIESYSNYYYDSKTNTKKMVSTDTRENTVETKSYYRVDNKILYQYDLKYLNKNYKILDGKFVFDKNLVNKEEYYIGENFRIFDKKIPKMLYFQATDYENFSSILEKTEQKVKIK